MSDQHGFTIRYDERVSQIVTEVYVSSDIFGVNDTIQLESMNARPYKAVWDTGATNSVITQKIIDELELEFIGMTKVRSVSHVVNSEVYLVCIYLPNGVSIPNLRVTKGSLGDIDLLIGMDIIREGDFAITYNEGKTVFSFRMPPLIEIDFLR